jgi:hypothetical protein
MCNAAGRRAFSINCHSQEITMNKRSWTKALIVSACLGAFTPVWAVDEAPPSGSVQITAKSIAVGVGINHGQGTLSYDGVQHHFSTSGLSVADLGISKITTNGEVFNLNNLKDFNGNYVAGAAGIAVAGGVDDVVMQNEHGVVLRLHGTEKGVRLQLGAQGVTLRLTS